MSLRHVSADLLYHLRSLYPPPEWLLATEVQAPRDGGGLRFADAIAFTPFKTKGFEVHGFEVKVSRADWLNEVKDPTKAQPALALCDRWYLVVGDASIVKDGEMPDSWGLIAPNAEGTALVVLKRATLLRSVGHDHPPLGRAFVAAFCHRLTFHEEDRPGWIERIKREAEGKGYQRGLNASRRLERKQQREMDGPRRSRSLDDDPRAPLNLP